MSRNVCVSTVTWARDAAEEQLLRRALARLAALNLPVAVADRGNSASFAAFLAGLPGFTVTAPGSRSLLGQVRASLGAAMQTGADFILYTEPDKELFFEAGLREFLHGAPVDGDVGVVLAARSEGSFATFPVFQQYTERTINHLCGEVVGTHGDYSYGPMLLNRVLIPGIDALGDEAGWGWRHFAVARARRLGYRVLHLPGEYPCPPDQRAERDPERLHRLRQLGQNIQGLVAALSVEPRGEARG